MSKQRRVRTGDVIVVLCLLEVIFNGELNKKDCVHIDQTKHPAHITRLSRSLWRIKCVLIKQRDIITVSWKPLSPAYLLHVISLFLWIGLNQPSRYNDCWMLYSFITLLRHRNNYFFITIWISSQIYRDILELSITLLRRFHWYPQQEGYNFFPLKSPFWLRQ